jgi:isopentenyl-diphosphate delta-isomerase
MVILVDENDNPIGTMPKMEAHEKAMLHRAFSVFILNANDEVLLQQRAMISIIRRMWTTTFASPAPGEVPGQRHG